VKIPSGGLDIAEIEHIIDELAHQVGVVFHLRGGIAFPPTAYRLPGQARFGRCLTKIFEQWRLTRADVPQPLR
jgi:hypothetical protein